LSSSSPPSSSLSLLDPSENSGTLTPIDWEGFGSETLSEAAESVASADRDEETATTASSELHSSPTQTLAALADPALVNPLDAVLIALTMLLTSERLKYFASPLLISADPL